jgi:PAS domain S-box-containing protein
MKKNTISQNTLDTLRNSDEKYRELAEMLPEIICEVDLNGKLLFANQYAMDKMGYTLDDFASKDWNIFSLFLVEEREKALISFKTCVSEQISSFNEYNVTTINGVVIPVEVCIKPLIENQKVIGVRGVMSDLSDRKNWENEIKNNLNQQKILSQVSMIFNSLNGFSQKVNEALQTIGAFINVSRVYIFENDIDDNYTSMKFEWCNEDVKSSLDEMQSYSYDNIPSWKQRLLDDEIIFSDDITDLPEDVKDKLIPKKIKSIIGLPLIVGNRQIGFIGVDECCEYRTWLMSEIALLKNIGNIISNAYQHRLDKLSIRSNEKETRAIIDSIPDIIFQLDENGIFQSWKGSNEDAFIIPSEEIVGRSIFDIFPIELSEKIQIAIKECIANGKFLLEYKLEVNDRLREYESRFVKINSKQVVSIVRDVTEQKEQETLLKQAITDAVHASEAKSEFLANVSHEIRTPMNAILGFSEVLLEKIENPLYKRHLKTILSSGRTLLSLINDILDLSKIEAGKMEIAYEPMQFDTLLYEIRQLFNQKVVNKNIALEILVDKTVPRFIMMDEVRLHQILFNLVGNAIKFTESGYIYVVASASKGKDLQHVNLNIHVEDTGIGIKEDQKDLIFEAFSQQSGQSNRKYEGTGLGLAITRKLIDKLGGNLSVESKLGKGSTFIIELKDITIVNNIKEDNIGKHEDDSLIIFSPATVMIVDDIDYNIMIIKSMVDDDNIRFIEANSGEEALELLETERPDMVFMDLRMGGISGFQTTEIIKSNDSIRDIPIVAFTASVMQNTIFKIKGLFDGFIRKPAQKKQVTGMMKKFLDYRYEYPVSEDAQEVTENNIETTSIEYLPELIEVLNKNFIPRWKEVKDDLMMPDLQCFAEDLEKRVRIYNCVPVQDFCEELLVGIESFDVDAIEKQMFEFPILIDELRKLLN